MSFLTAYLAQLDKPAKAPKAVQAKKPSVSKAAQLQALAALEEARHQQLCQLLEHTLPNHCDDYLRQLATTAVQVRTMAEIATLQAQLLQQQGKPPQPGKPRKSR